MTATELSKNGLIDVTGVDLRRLVAAAYELSRPQGMGFMHFQPGGLTPEEVELLMRPETSDIAISLDYVKGRAIKLVVWRDLATWQLTIRDSWFDHSTSALEELLTRVNWKPVSR